MVSAGAVLAADAEALDKSFIALRATATQVVQEPAAPSDHLQEAPARMMVLGVSSKMLLQFSNAPAEDGNLHFWRAGVRLMNPELRNHFTLCFARQCHSEIDTPRLFLTDLFRFSE